MRRKLYILVGLLVVLLALLAARSFTTPPEPPEPPGPVAGGEDGAARPGDLDVKALPGPAPEGEPTDDGSSPEAGRPVTTGDIRGRVPWLDYGRECVTLAPELAGAKVFVQWRSAEPAGEAVLFDYYPPRLPLEPGVFWSSALTPGTYEFEFSAVKDGVLVRAKTTVVVGEEGGEMPPVRLEPRAGVRARVLDADGKPVPQARIVVVRPEEDPGRGHRVEPGPDGWIAYRDLEPGVYHRVVVYGVPEEIERTVRVPPEPKGVAQEEIRLEARVVPVKLRFMCEEKDSKEIPIAAVSARLVETGWEWESAADLGEVLLPGTYEFRAGDSAGRLVVRKGIEVDGTVTLSPRSPRCPRCPARRCRSPPAPSSSPPGSGPDGGTDR
ncbi:MAG: peptidase associated/transthyretin-like domain-containing protein [Planctomycetota bacterium]